MLDIKSSSEIEQMQKATRITGETLKLLSSLVRVGITTEELDKEAAGFIKAKGASPSFLGYDGYPKSVCISVNDQVVHGIPGKYALRDGDIVSCDVGAYIDGFHGDAARTFIVGNVPDEVKQLVKVTEECFFAGLKFAKPGYHISDIARAIQTHAESHGYGVVRELIGHGVGRKLHESPEVPNFTDIRMGRGAKLVPGMTLAIEPMINLGTREVRVERDGWTVTTADHKPSAHYENTIAITENEPVIMTLFAEE